jgi:DNA-directed RNA polymerase specialized sigma24 family protein
MKPSPPDPYTSPEMEDLALIERARRGDHAAYGALVERYKAAILKLAFRILRHPGDAEDAAQDAFVRAYVALDTYNPQYRFYTWIAAITQNVCFRSLPARRPPARQVPPGADPTALARALLRRDRPRHRALALGGQDAPTPGARDGRRCAGDAEAAA